GLHGRASPAALRRQRPAPGGRLLRGAAALGPHLLPLALPLPGPGPGQRPRPPARCPGHRPVVPARPARLFRPRTARPGRPTKAGKVGEAGRPGSLPPGPLSLSLTWESLPRRALHGETAARPPDAADVQVRRPGPRGLPADPGRHGAVFAPHPHPARPLRL